MPKYKVHQVVRCTKPPTSSTWATVGFVNTVAPKTPNESITTTIIITVNTDHLHYLSPNGVMKNITP